MNIKNNHKPTIAVIGAGQRGKDTYSMLIKQYHSEAQIVAVAEPNRHKRAEMAELFNISQEMQFSCWSEFFAKPKMCDAVIIATPDHLHFEPAKKALELDYHVLLEKPMSNDVEECAKLGVIAKEKGKIFVIGHVLRYTPFFSTLKDLIVKKTIGDLMTIQHNENIGYYHFAHSFVRGIWNNSKTSSPLILAKSCHDMDILLWLVGDDCTKISSYGHLTHFTKENAPKNAGNRCVTCDIENDCPYSAKKIYYPNIGRWPTTVISDNQTEEAVIDALHNGNYGKCVYHSDNNVVDHQVTILEFSNNVTATFNLSAFTNEINRTIKLMGSLGEIRANMHKNEIEISLFGNPKKVVITPTTIMGGHGGGDGGLTQDFVNLLKGKEGKALTSAEKSVQSHIMAFAAEKSRVSNKSVNIKDFHDSILKE